MKIMQHLRNSLLRSEIITHLTIGSVRTSISRSPWRRGISRSLIGAPTLVFLLLAAAPALGGSATWNLNPADDFWGEAINWTPATVPNGPNDTATFGVSNITDIDATNNDSFVTEVNGIVFNPGASAFTIAMDTHISFDLALTISGVGITNNSGITQNFTISDNFAEENSVIHFSNSERRGTDCFHCLLLLLLRPRYPFV